MAVRRMKMMIGALVVMVALACANADQTSTGAEALLDQALERYSALDFASAKDLLLEIDRDQLATRQQRTLDSYLGFVDRALTAQTAGQQLLAAGQEALDNGDLTRARSAFMRAASNEFLTAEDRQQANRGLEAVSAADVPGATAAPAVVLGSDTRLSDEQVVPARPIFGEVVLADATDEEEPLPPVIEGPDVVDAEADPDYDQLLAAGSDALAEGLYDEAADFFRQAIMATDEPAEAQRLLRLTQEQQALAQPAEPVHVAIVEDSNDAVMVLAANDDVEELPSEMTADSPIIVENTNDPAPVTVVADDTMGPVVDDGLGESGTLNEARRNLQIQRDHAEVVYTDAMTRARQLLAGARDDSTDEGFDDATLAVGEAQVVLDTQGYLFTDEAVRGMQAEIASLLTQIESDHEEWAIEQIRVIEEERRAAEQARVLAEEQERAATLATMQQRARILISEENFEEALDVVDRMLEIDPQNTYAQPMAEILADMIGIIQQRQNIDNRDRQEQLISIEAIESSIPWTEYVTYPDDWRELSRRRLGVETDVRDSEENQLVRQRLDRRDTFSFDNIDLDTVFNYFQNTYGLNLYIDWNGLELADVTRQTPVEVRLSNVTVGAALETVLNYVSQSGNPLGFFVDQGMVRVSTQEEINTRVFSEIYPIEDLLVSAPDFIGPRMEMDISQVGGGGGDLWGEEPEEDTGRSREEMIQDLIDTLQESIDPESWGLAANIRNYRGQLIITQTSDNHRKILELLNKMRESRAIQISIESRFIEVTSGFLERIGIDLDVYFNVNSPLYAATPDEVGNSFPGGPRTYDPWTQAWINRELPTSGPNSSNWSPIAINTGNKLDWVTAATGIAGDIGSSTTGAPTAMSIAASFLDDIEVDFLIESTQANIHSRILTAPRLTLFNGQRAYITVARQTAYIESWEPLVAEGVAALQPIVGYIPTGSVLDVEATVSADRRYVSMTIRPQLAEFVPPLRSVPFTVGSGIGIGTEATIELPEVDLKDLQTTVSVPDGGTLMLGGQKLAGQVDREVGPPVLSKIPVVNRFFTSRGTTQDERMLLILVKPRIIIQREEEELAFP